MGSEETGESPWDAEAETSPQMEKASLWGGGEGLSGLSTTSPPNRTLPLVAEVEGNFSRSATPTASVTCC